MTKFIFVVAALAFATVASVPTAFGQNMQYYASDTNLQCDRDDMKLTLKFDGTGDHVDYVWNGVAGSSAVKWRADRATFNLDGAVNGPFTFNFRERTFYFQDVPCREL